MIAPWRGLVSVYRDLQPANNADKDAGLGPRRIRQGDNLDRVVNGQATAGRRETILDLDQTTDIAGGQGVGSSCEDVLDLAVSKHARDGRLLQVVRPC